MSNKTKKGGETETNKGGEIETNDTPKKHYKEEGFIKGENGEILYYIVQGEDGKEALYDIVPRLISSKFPVDKRDEIRNIFYDTVKYNYESFFPKIKKGDKIEISQLGENYILIIQDKPYKLEISHTYKGAKTLLGDLDPETLAIGNLPINNLEELIPPMTYFKNINKQIDDKTTQLSFHFDKNKRSFFITSGNIRLNIPFYMKDLKEFNKKVKEINEKVMIIIEMLNTKDKLALDGDFYSRRIISDKFFNKKTFIEVKTSNKYDKNIVEELFVFIMNIKGIPKKEWEIKGAVLKGDNGIDYLGFPK